MNPDGATRTRVFDLLRHALTTTVFCCVIAAALTVSGRGAWDVQLVYSLSIGLVSLAVIDTGWWLLARGEGSFWRQGWRGPGLLVFGTAIGFVVGSSVGDAYSGYSTWQLWSLQPYKFVSIIVISMIATIVVAYFFYSRGTARALEAQIAIAERDAAEARLKLLAKQLDPHMLFNTLANLRVLIGTDPARATAMVDRLNSYLRVTLSGSRALAHPLAAEFDRLADYLELMAVRMGPRLAYRLDLPSELREVPVPSLLLQPLVENSIRHGLEPQVEGGEIAVSARREGERVVIEVRDTGAGAGAAPPSDGSGFGLTQVRERLASAYGSAGAMNLIAAAEGGTCVRVEFPV